MITMVQIDVPLPMLAVIEFVVLLRKKAPKKVSVVNRRIVLEEIKLPKLKDPELPIAKGMSKNYLS